MELCYPALLLLILALYLCVNIIISGKLYWTAGPVFASPPFIFAIIAYYLCKKGYNKMAWGMPLLAILFTGLLVSVV